MAAEGAGRWTFEIIRPANDFHLAVTVEIGDGCAFQSEPGRNFTFLPGLGWVGAGLVNVDAGGGTVNRIDNKFAFAVAVDVAEDDIVRSAERRGIDDVARPGI